MNNISDFISQAVTVSQMREYDKYTIENICPSVTLMMRAAKGIYDSVVWKNKKIAIICGSGNNGGDGYALASILKENGENVTIFRLSEKFSEDGKYYFDIAKSMNIDDYLFDNNTDLTAFDIVVDCILGTGFSGKVRDNVFAAIEKINNSGAFVVSADINSGMNGDTGEAEIAVKSDITVSIGFYKIGMFSESAKKYIKELVNVDIGIKKTK